MYELNTKLPSTLNSVVNKVMPLFLQYLLDIGEIKSITEKRKSSCKVSLEVFFSNTVNPILSGKNYVNISLDKNVYNKGVVQNGVRLSKKVSYTYTKLLLQYLNDNGWGSLELGGREYEGIKDEMTGRWVSTIVSSSVTTFSFSEAKRQMLWGLIKDSPRMQLKDVYIVRDSNGISIVYKSNSESKGILQRLNNYNKLSIRTDISMVGSEYKYNVQLRRICNMSSFYNGARHYCPEVQTLSKAERRKLTIEGNETVIYDFSGFEPSIAYTLMGAEMDGDPYQTEVAGYDSKVLRDVGKLIMLRLLHADNEDQVIFSTNNEIHKEWNLGDLERKGKIPDKYIPVREVLDQLLDKHKAIESYFYGKGDKNLPNVGSNIIDYILEYFLQNYGSLVIPVFDEIIAEKHLEEEIVKVMTKGWLRVLGNSDNCKITKEK